MMITIKDIINHINDLRMPEQRRIAFAASYAYECAYDVYEKSNEEYFEDEVQNQLDYLVENGAIFDYSKVLDIALDMHKEFNNVNTY